MKKKVLAAVMTGIMAASLAACGSGSGSTGSSAGPESTAAAAEEGATAEATQTAEAQGDGGHIVILTAPEDHGWTGSVATFAKEKAEEVNAEGKYTAEVITCDDAAYQINQVEDLIAKNDKDLKGIVIQPIDDTVQSAIQEIVDAGIPYVAFDRIIDAVSSSAVSNVKGDNEGIGAGCANYFVSLGLKPGDKVYVYEGDTSSVTTLRDQGFTEYLKGDIDFNGETIADADKWTDEDLANITYSGAMNWSRSDTKTAYESLMGDASNADIKWFYGEDDELAMGILEALNGGGIDDATKEKIFATRPVITGCGGLDEFYAVLRGETYTDIAANCDGLMSVTYSPSMIQTAIQDMVDYLDGKEVTQDHVIECQNVTADNVKDFVGFN